MREAFKELPQALQRQVILRAGFSLGFVFIFIALLVTTNDLYAILPAIAMVAFCAGSAAHLFRRAITKDYVMVTGVCEEVSKTLFTRRIKTIIISTEQHVIQVSPWHRPRRVPRGACIELYISPRTLVYEKDGVQVLHGYLAMAVKGEKPTDG